MSCRTCEVPVAGSTEFKHGYALSEDARDATRYVLRVAVLRQALYHGCRTRSFQASDRDMPGPAVGERF